MTCSKPTIRALVRLGAGSALALALAGTALAQAPADTAAQLQRIEAQLAVQSARLAQQEERLAAQQAVIERQARQLSALQSQRDAALADIRAGSRGGVVALADSSAGQRLVAEGAPPEGPVGQAPSTEARVREVAAIPEHVGVLTPPGQLVLDPTLEYVRSSRNRLVFRGVEIVPGIQLGVIEASDADRDALVATAAARYGLTDRLEAELRIPYVYRHDRLTTLAQRDQTISRSQTLEGQDIGDIEIGLRYQMTSGENGAPIFIANGRVKPPTGRGPYDVDYDEFGVASDLATGSGFWGVEVGATMLYPTDPAVIFAGLSYTWNIAEDVDKTIGDVRVGRVDPGDSIGATLGFGLALNPRLSVSFGYSHNYIFRTRTQLGDTTQKSTSLQVGSLLMGASYRFSEELNISTGFEFGVTSDAPDMRLVIRAPYQF